MGERMIGVVSVRRGDLLGVNGDGMVFPIWARDALAAIAHALFGWLP